MPSTVNILPSTKHLHVVQCEILNVDSEVDDDSLRTLYKINCYICGKVP